MRDEGYSILLESQDGRGWSYAVRPGKIQVANARDLEGLAVGGGVSARCDPDFRDGWILLLSYDFGRRFEKIAAPGVAPYRAPEAILMEAADVLPMENVRRGSVFRSSRSALSWREVVSATDYARMVRSAKEYIAAGDIYQVNLARCFEAEYDGDPFALYTVLGARNPSPYAAYLEIPPLDGAPGFAVVSSSPELLVSIEGRHMVTRPIAGTYPRERSVQDLPRDPKERAEHVMLVDHERNDLGRLARPGSVRVDELLAVETYSHVHHIVSEVSAELAAPTNLLEVLRAVFPGGTITGTPKIRAMELISELEPVRRGFYTGAVGYLTRSGNLRLNILIRTAVVQKNRIHLAAGAGIVADSVPEREAEETRIKAASFLELGTI